MPTSKALLLFLLYTSVTQSIAFDWMIEEEKCLDYRWLFILCGHLLEGDLYNVIPLFQTGTFGQNLQVSRILFTIFYKNNLMHMTYGLT